MANHHIGEASQSRQGPKNNILQQILDKIQEQSIKIATLKHSQPAQQLLNKIQEQSLKIKTLKHAQKTPAITRNPSPNPAIHIKLKGSAESQKLHNPPRKQKALPDPEKFTGDRRDFKRWHFKVSHKLEADRDTLGPERTQFNYVYSQLGRAAQNIAVPFAEKAAQTGLYNTNGLLNYLKECYTNPDTNQRALKRLRRIRQRENKPFAAFLPRFERELMESNGAVWPNYFKVSYLKRALNTKITNYLITLNPDHQNYPNFIKVIQQTSSHLQAFNSAFLGKNRPNYKANYKVNNGNHGKGNAMQWEPTGSAKAAITGSQRRAK